MVQSNSGGRSSNASRYLDLEGPTGCKLLLNVPQSTLGVFKPLEIYKDIRYRPTTRHATAACGSAQRAEAAPLDLSWSSLQQTSPVRGLGRRGVSRPLPSSVPFLSLYLGSKSKVEATNRTLDSYRREGCTPPNRSNSLAREALKYTQS